ncbi:glycosyltransferase family 4 protein [Candidatus Parcubacteria bacterium]|nr:glycosyltransferase family 4 protein [Patescibacteria group bacterium]MCG2689208.1 glycosyltransferase family 4 protein [Candidatus Parcubacteria bacterium]
MKILHITYEYPLPWFGIAPNIYELIKAQVRLPGNEVTVIKGGFDKPVMSHRNLRIIGVPHLIPGLGHFFSTSPFSLFGYLYLKMFNKVDVVIGHNHVTFWFSLYKLLFGKLDKTPYIAYFHTVASQTEEIWRVHGEEASFLERHLELPLRRIAEKMALKTADFVYGESWEILEDLGVGENSYSDVLFPGIDSRHYSTKFKGLRSSYSFEGKKVILYCDYISSYGKADLLVEVLTKLPKDYSLMIVGDAEVKFLQKLKDKISKLNLDNRVTVKENVFYREYIQYYQTCDIVVLPSVRKSSHIRIIEALASSKPVLCYIPRPERKTEAVINEYCQRILKLEPEYIANKIRHILDSPPKINVDKVKSEYDWSTRAKKMEDVINNLV